MTFLARSTRLAAAIAFATVVSSCGGGGDGITVGTTVTGVRFVTQPAGAGAGVAFTVSVELIGSNGNRATGATDPVTLTINNGATITGTAVAASVEGLATFTGISISQIGTGFLLTATAKGFTTQSTSFSITDPCTAVVISFPGVTNGSLPSGACTVGGSPAAVFRFTASPQNANGFSVASVFSNPALDVTTIPPAVGGNIIWVPASPASTSVSGEWLVPAGSYLVRVGTRTTNGTFTLTGTTGPFNTAGCVFRSLIVSIQVTQALANSDCVFESDGTFYDKFALFSQRACTITMQSATMRSFLLIVDAGGNNIVNGDDSGGNGLTAEVTLAGGCNNNNGPIQIFANTFDVQTGSYSLTVTFAPAPSSVLAPVAPVPAVPVFAGAPLSVSEFKKALQER